MPAQITPTSDKLIREVLVDKISSFYTGKEHTVVIPEFTIPNESARADIAVVNGIMHGYELKSDLDSLYRLKGQANSYSKVFDKITLVVGKSHLAESLELVPDWWGITVAKIPYDEYTPLLIEIREAKYNPNKNLLTITNLLWKEEWIDIMKSIGLGAGLSNLTKQEICLRAIEKIDPSQIEFFVRNTLFEREFNRDKQVVVQLNSCGDSFQR